MTASVPNATAFTYDGDGSTRAFAFPLRFLESADLQVSVIAANGDETLKTIGSHYAVSGAGNSNGGTVTFNVGQAPASGDTVKISRRTQPKQTIDFEDSGRVPGDTLEQQLDRMAMALQDLEQRFSEVETTPGPPGMTAYLFGDGAPSSAAGNDSDIYQDRLTGDQYKKADGSWVLQANIKGPQGDKGDKGDTGDLGEFDPEATTARIDALEATALKPGDGAFSFRKLTSDPDGFLICIEARTIGDGDSNADVADAKCEALFEALWDDFDNTELPILDSAGDATTRGDNAAADWAAHKRLPLPDPFDRFLRFASTTRDAGLKEANQNKQHNHSATFTGNALPGHSHNMVRNKRRGANGNDSNPGWDGGDVFLSSNNSFATTSVSAGTPSGSVSVANDGGTEARPDSFVVTCLIKL